MYRKNKTTLILIICVSFMFTGCSFAGDKSALYSPQGTINFNYNNISANNSFWMTNENICYLEDFLYQCYSTVTEKEKSIICANSGYGLGAVQQYGNLIYMLDLNKYIDEYNSIYLLKVYDIKTKKTEEITVLKNCDNYLLLNETVFYLQKDWTQTPRKLSLHSYSPDLDTHTTIRNDVLSFGVIDDHLVYATKEENIVSIFKYDEGNMSSEKIGEFPIECSNDVDFNEYAIICYTSNYVLVEYTDWENDTSTIWKYAFVTNDVSQISFDGCINDFISYDKFSYLAIYEDKDTEMNCIYRLSNDSNELLKIGQFDGGCDLFVGSDEGTYALQHNEAAFIYISNEGDLKIVHE